MVEYQVGALVVVCDKDQKGFMCRLVGDKEDILYHIGPINDNGTRRDKWTWNKWVKWYEQNDIVGGVSKNANIERIAGILGEQSFLKPGYVLKLLEDEGLITTNPSYSGPGARIKNQICAACSLLSTKRRALAAARTVEASTLRGGSRYAPHL
jgi:hypothetical protein